MSNGKSVSFYNNGYFKPWLVFSNGYVQFFSRISSVGSKWVLKKFELDRFICVCKHKY